MRRLGNEYKNDSISHGTLLTEDLLPKFLSVLDDAGHPKHEELWEATMLCSSAKKYCEESLAPDYVINWFEDELDFLLNERVWPAMDDIAPEGCYFGAAAGDGTDFGFWEIVNENNPEDDDYYTNDYVEFYTVGGGNKLVVKVGELEDYRKVLLDKMKKDGWYPNVWHISNYGNLTKLSLRYEGD